MIEGKKSIRYIKNFFIYLLLLALTVVFIMPFVWLLSTALKSSSQSVYSFPPTFIPRPPVLDNFIEAWTSVPFPKYLFNSFALIVLMVPAHLFLTALTAYPLARMDFPGKKILFYLVLGTMFMPEEAMLVPMFLMAQELNLANSWGGVVFPGLVGGFAIFLMRQSYLSIPKEMEEAAKIDGCGFFKTWWKVILPMARPTLAALSIISFVSVWNSFMWPLIILNNDNLYPLSLGLAYLSGTFGNEVRVMAAGTVISLVPIIVFYLMMQKHFVAGLAQGAVKG